VGQTYLPGALGIGRTSENADWGINIAKDSWAIVTRKANGVDNAEPKNPRSSIYTNDIFLRSV
jgi:hypothetical protein